MTSFLHSLSPRHLTLAAIVPLVPALLAASCSGGELEESDLPPNFSGQSTVGSQLGNTNNANAQPGVGTTDNTVNNTVNNGTNNNMATGQPVATVEGQQQSGQRDNNQQQAQQQNGQQQADQGAGGAAMTNDGMMANAGAANDPNAGAGGGTMTIQDPNPPQPPVTGVDCGSALLCDDFEGIAAGSSPDPAIWDMIVSYNQTSGQTDSIQVTTEQAHSGNQSVFVSGANGRTGMIGTINASNYYVRAWMFAESAPLGPVLAGFGADGNNEVRFRIWNNSWATINSTVGDDLVPQAARAGNCPDCPVVPAQQWFCMEYFVNDAAQTATLWIDGDEAAVLNGSWPNMPADPKIFLGVMRIQDGTDLFIDDVVASVNPIGCN